MLHSFWHLQLQLVKLPLLLIWRITVWGVLFVFLSHIVITYQGVCSSAGKGSPSFNNELKCFSCLLLLFHRTWNISLLSNGTGNVPLPPNCEWSQSENLSLAPAGGSLTRISVCSEVSRRRWVPEKPGSGVWANTDETAAPLSLWEAVERPPLSHTLASFHPAISYLSF